MSARWLDIFFRFSGRIFHLKQNLVNSNRWYVAVYYAFLLIFTELGLVVISFPLYIIVSPDKIQKGGVYTVPSRPSSIQEYILRRRIGLTSGAGVLAMLFVKFALVGLASLVLLGPQKLLADTQNWTFGSSADYMYNTSVIEIVGGAARLKDFGVTTASTSVNSDFDIGSTGWTAVDNWVNGGANTENYVSTDGDPGGNINITQSINNGQTSAAFWRQPFTTTVSGPTGTLSLDWSVPVFNGGLPLTYKIYAFIDAASGNPATSTAVWNSGEIIATTTNWSGVINVDISSKIVTSGTYYLKVGIYGTQPSTGGVANRTASFDNISVNWSKTTHVFVTSSPTTTPITSLSAPKIRSWDSFVESASPDGGSIKYQLSGDNGVSWKFWNGSSWVTTTLSSDTNSSSTINANIIAFPTSTNQIKWRAYFLSNGSQAVSLSGITINYTQNSPPQIIDLLPAQYSGHGDVRIGYNIQDAESDPASLVAYEYSLTGAFAGEEVTMIPLASDEAHSGISALGSSPTGVAHTFAWDAHAQLGNVAIGTVYVRLRGNDGIASGAYATSSAFAVNFVPPPAYHLPPGEAVGDLPPPPEVVVASDTPGVVTPVIDTTVPSSSIAPIIIVAPAPSTTQGPSPASEVISSTPVVLRPVAPTGGDVKKRPALPVVPRKVTLPVAPASVLIRANVDAIEVPSLPIPEIVSGSPTISGDTFVFSGTALPNQEVLVYLHSTQALIYQTRADSQGVWKVEHSQETTELEVGDHTIFAVAVDPINKVKSRPSTVHTFEVTKNFWVNLFQLLNLPTTLFAIVALGFTMMWLYRIRTREGAEV